MVDYAMMSRNVRGFMSLFHCGKPVVCKVHGFCVAGGTDMALCSDLLVIARGREDRLPAGARVGLADDGAVGAPRRRPARQAAAVHRRLAVRARGASSGGSRSRRRRAEQLDERTEVLSSGSRAMPRQPADDDEAARQPDALRAGPARHAGARHRVRRHRAPHRRGLRLPAARGRARASARPCASATSRSATSGARRSRAERAPRRRVVRPRRRGLECRFARM